MTNANATPQCFAEIYPFEGGSFELTSRGGGVGSSAPIIQCTVEKVLKDSGKFTIILAPGGPTGVDASPSWAEVITPMSFCLIGMARWIYRETVMIGVVTKVMETQHWVPDKGVTRVTVITGEDLTYFFTSFSWVSLSFLAGATAAVGQSVAGDQNAGLPAILSGSLLSGTPAQVAQAWFDQVMAGTQGILSQTTLAYAGSRISIAEAIGTAFDEYPGFTIPFGDSFVSNEGSWLSKFRAILAWPWYEFFVNTAPSGFYRGAGSEFSMADIGPTSLSGVTAVGRLNPIPVIQTTGSGQSMTLDGVDTTAWDSLFSFSEDCRFIEHDISFDPSNVRNFYVLNPVWSRMMLGQNNTSLIPFILSFVGAYDPDSIHRYGFHPEFATTRWMADLQGSSAQNSSNSDFNDMVADLTSRVFSFYHPLPLMGKASVTYPLRPDIIPGNQFTYAPFKGGDPWDFYIEGIKHSFTFGGRSSTTLTLSRGLPSLVYADVALLGDVLLGTAERSNGIYQPSSGGGTGLTSFGIQDANSVMSQIAEVYAQPQKG